MSVHVGPHPLGVEPPPGQAASGRGPKAPGRQPARSLGPYLRTARPRQWLKNVLVLAAPAAAGVIFDPRAAINALVGVAAFTLAATGTYFINDAFDAAADRLHPVKSHRPVARGLITPRVAKLVGLVCALGSLAIAALLGWTFGALVAAYLALTALYSIRIKHLPVLDILAVAAGFLLRAAGGGAATGVPLSNWFLLVALFGSLFLVTAKRAAEQARRTAGEVHARPTLDAYPGPWLGQVMTMTLTGTVLGYALWAFQYVGPTTAQPLLAISLLPFLTVLLRYSLLVAQGQGEEPERLITTDRFLMAAAAAWAVTVGAGIYLG